MYGVLTAGHRTWGGPRADAAEADAFTTPFEAAEFAMRTGDELNVIPETFHISAKIHANRENKQVGDVSLQPPSQFEGRFRSLSRSSAYLLRSVGRNRHQGYCDRSRDNELDDLLRVSSSPRPDLFGSGTTSIDSFDGHTHGRRSEHLPQRSNSIYELEYIEAQSRPPRRHLVTGSSLT